MDHFNYQLCYGCQHPRRATSGAFLLGTYSTTLCPDCMNQFELACQDSDIANGYVLQMARLEMAKRQQDIRDLNITYQNAVAAKKAAFTWAKTWLRDHQRRNGVTPPDDEKEIDDGN